MKVVKGMKYLGFSDGFHNFVSDDGCEKQSYKQCKFVVNPTTVYFLRSNGAKDLTYRSLKRKCNDSRALGT